jgi:probable F420-dependent oxidoreductase
MIESLPLAQNLTFGLHCQLPDPAHAQKLVRLAEDGGFTSIAVGDHLAFALPILDPFIQLAQVATLSDRLKVQTSVYLLPLRHPTPVAKQAATLDRISGGRFVMGLGVGGEFPGEFAAAGVPHHERGARLNEGIAVLRKLWTGEPVRHEGRFFSFPETQMLPPPVRPGGPPLWVGGRSDAALKRAGTLCDGYISYVITPDRFARALQSIGEHFAASKREMAEYGTAHLLFMRLGPTYDQAYDDANRLLSQRYAMDFSEPTRRYAALGAPADIAAFIDQFYRAGCRHLEVDFLGTPQERVEQIEQFGREVKPLLSFAA